MPLKIESLSALDHEIDRCRAKFPGSRFLLPALIEEVGELAQAVIAGDRAAVEKEAIQVACVAMRIVEEHDPVDYSLSHVVDIAAGIGLYVRARIAGSRAGAYLDEIRRATYCLDEGHADACFAGRTAEESKA